jgi:hypothetical protein
MNSLIRHIVPKQLPETAAKENVVREFIVPEVRLFYTLSYFYGYFTSKLICFSVLHCNIDLTPTLLQLCKRLVDFPRGKSSNLAFSGFPEPIEWLSENRKFVKLSSVAN